MSGFVSPGRTPNLIHAVTVKVERLDAETTLYDDVYREPTADAKYKPVETVRAQIHWKEMEELVASPMGNDIMADGWITMRQVEIAAMADGPFKQGDRIIEIDGVSYAEDPLYIEQPFKAGHYTTAKLWRFFFRSRSESPDNQGSNRSNAGSGL